MTLSEYTERERIRTKGLSKETRKGVLFGPTLVEFHKGAIEKALRMGRPVPPEVLKDYPDLAPSPVPTEPKALSKEPKAGKAGEGLEKIAPSAPPAPPAGPWLRPEASEVSPKADKPPVVPEATLTETRGVEGATKAKEIGGLYDYALGKAPNVKRFVTYRTVDANEAARIKEATGLDIEGHNRTIDNYAIRHILKRHGKEGQLSVTKEDILRIPEITAMADRVMPGDKKGTIRYEKKINGIIYAIEEVRAGQKELATVTLYKTKAVSDKMPPTETPPVRTSETTRPPSKQTIPPTPGKVKPTPPRDILQEQPATGESAFSEISPAGGVSPKGGQAGITAESLAEKYPEASIKVKPTKEGYTGQAEYEKATYTISGKTEAEVLERLDKRLASAVPYEEAQPTRKRETEATAMTPEEMEKMAAPEEGPSGYASTGGYKRPLKGMEMPEIVKLAKEINQGEINFVVCRLVFQDNSCADLFGGSPKDYRKGTPAGPLYFFISSLATL